MLLTNDIVFSHWFSSNRQFKRKKTKTFGLALLTYKLGRVGRRCSQPCPTNRPTATRQLVRQSFAFYLISSKSTVSYPELAQICNIYRPFFNIISTLLIHHVPIACQIIDSRVYSMNPKGDIQPLDFACQSNRLCETGKYPRRPILSPICWPTISYHLPTNLC